MTRSESYWRRLTSDFMSAWSKLESIRRGRTLKPKRPRVECSACGKVVTRCNNGRLIQHKCIAQKMGD